MVSARTTTVGGCIRSPGGFPLAHAVSVASTVTAVGSARRMGRIQLPFGEAEALWDSRLQPAAAAQVEGPAQAVRDEFDSAQSLCPASFARNIAVRAVCTNAAASHSAADAVLRQVGAEDGRCRIGRELRCSEAIDRLAWKGDVGGRIACQQEVRGRVGGDRRDHGRRWLCGRGGRRASRSGRRPGSSRTGLVRGGLGGTGATQATASVTDRRRRDQRPIEPWIPTSFRAMSDGGWDAVADRSCA